MQHVRWGLPEPPPVAVRVASSSGARVSSVIDSLERNDDFFDTICPDPDAGSWHSETGAGPDASQDSSSGGDVGDVPQCVPQALHGGLEVDIPRVVGRLLTQMASTHLKDREERTLWEHEGHHPAGHSRPNAGPLAGAWAGGVSCSDGSEDWDRDLVARPDSLWAGGEDGRAGRVPRTTLVMQGLPFSYTRDRIVEMLQEHGFRNHCDFIYVPSNFETGATFGYAFVNLTSEGKAAACWLRFDGFRDWGVPCDRICEVSWASIHGLEANIDRYRNSSVMHPSVPDHFKPMLMGRHGTRIRFPPPTRPIKAPKRRQQK